MMSLRNKTASALLVGLVCLLVGTCEFSAAQSGTWASTTALGTSTQQQPVDEWWKTFQDQQLTELIQRAISNNLNLKLAAARVEEARAARGIEKSALYPSVSSGLSASRTQQRIAAVAGTGATGFRPLELNNFQIGFDSSWELDMFGRIRNEVKAATSDLRSAEENRRDVLVTLLGDLATTYADLRGFQLRLQIAQKNIQSQNDKIGRAHV